LTEKIAVIGTGIAGMASAWLLGQRYQTLLIDKNNYIGGHTNTISVADVDLLYLQLNLVLTSIETARRVMLPGYDSSSSGGNP
jgi:heterodisulfide reductase subunit A-like polyferredoxin